MYLFLGGLGGCCASSSASGPLDMSVCISYGDPWKLIISFSNANVNAYPNANANANALLNLFLQQVVKHHPFCLLLVGWAGAVPHPLPGVPLTFLSVICARHPMQSTFWKCWKNTDFQKVRCIRCLPHDFFLFGWVGGCCASSSARGPPDIPDISYKDPWAFFSNANANANANPNAKVLLKLFLPQ